MRERSSLGRASPTKRSTAATKRAPAASAEEPFISSRSSKRRWSPKNSPPSHFELPSDRRNRQARELLQDLYRRRHPPRRALEITTVKVIEKGSAELRPVRTRSRRLTLRVVNGHCNTNPVSSCKCIGTYCRRARSSKSTWPRYREHCSWREPL